MRTALKILLGILLAVGLSLYWLLYRLEAAFAPTLRRIELISSKHHKLYIKSKNWGVTDDKQLNIITTEGKRDFEIDSTSQIVFHGLDPFLYRVSNDTLYLTLMQKRKIPEDFKSGWTIIQTEVDNPTMMKLRDSELNSL